MNNQRLRYSPLSNDALLVQAEPKEDGNHSEEDGVKEGRQDTLDNSCLKRSDPNEHLMTRSYGESARTKHDSWDRTEPSEPAGLSAQGINVGDSSDESQERSPNDDQPDGDRPTDDFTDLSRMGVHRRVVPDDILGYDFDSGLDGLPALFLVNVPGKDVSLVLSAESAKGMKTV